MTDRERRVARVFEIPVLVAETTVATGCPDSGIPKDIGNRVRLLCDDQREASAGIQVDVTERAVVERELIADVGDRGLQGFEVTREAARARLVL
jgi:hypothetical protein